MEVFEIFLRNFPKIKLLQLLSCYKEDIAETVYEDLIFILVFTVKSTFETLTNIFLALRHMSIKNSLKERKKPSSEIKRL